VRFAIPVPAGRDGMGKTHHFLCAVEGWKREEEPGAEWLDWGDSELRRAATLASSLFSVT